MSTTEPKIELDIRPDGTFIERAGSVETGGRWMIWTHLGDMSTGVSFAALKPARGPDPNERSWGHVKHMLFVKRLIVEGGLEFERR